MELVGRWWNGIWGQLARRDIWLYRQAAWHVHAREGDSETGRELRWQFQSEAEARAMVDRLMRARGPGEWRDLTEISTRRRAPPAPDQPDPTDT